MMRKKLDLSAAMAHVAQREALPLTLAELVAAFNTRMTGDYDLRLRKWVQGFGSMSAWELTENHLENAIAAMRDAGYKPASINRDLSALGTCYRWAKAERISPRGFVSPTLGIKRASEGIRRVEVSTTEINALLARSLATQNRMFGLFVHLLVDTGARKSELLERRWKDVNLDAHTILCPTTKTGVPRILHFQPATAVLMRRLVRNPHPERLLFEGRAPGVPVSYRTAWQNLTAAMGRPDLHMHDVRHHAAADLLRAGVTLGVAAQVLGHSPQVLARRYGHLETGTLRKAQEQRWGVAA